MRDAVIVSTARTPIGRAYKGAFNATPGPTLGALSIAPAIERAGIEAGEINDVVWGCVLAQGTQAGNIGRLAALRADHQCAGENSLQQNRGRQTPWSHLPAIALSFEETGHRIKTSGHASGHCSSPKTCRYYPLDQSVAMPR